MRLDHSLLRPLPAVACLLLSTAACAPSRAALFDPVRDAIRARTHVTPEWRAGGARSAAAQARVGEVLAAPVTADGAAEIAILSNPELQAAFEDLTISGAVLVEGRV